MNDGAFASYGIIADDVARIAGKAIDQVRPFSAGNGTDIYLADMKDGSRVVIKRARGADMALDIEGWMLRYLQEHSDLPVPEVLCAERSLLIINYVPDCGRITGMVEADAARHLAALHRIGNRQYGLSRDTRIGPFPQPNAFTGDWVAFFRDYRLIHMARAALNEGALPPALMEGIEAVAERLGEWLTDPAPPVLIHGDLWSGNVLTSSHKVNAFIDPAIYYADPEIELAFIALFSTFGERFFKSYAELNPIRPGFFEVRKDIYTLYPLLVHARLFGGAYLEKIGQIVTRLTGRVG
jgi:fructosamine-3-kinase